ncbi:MAG: hypothetical protein HRF50_05010 [Phycisphaerae bacterium]|jgi:uncharacterized protein YceK
MRMLLLTLGFVVAMSLLSGCAGVVKTPEDRANTYSQVADMDMRQLNDDWDGFWLADRQYRMTRWRLR